MVETNESPQAGVAREIREELGLARVIGRPLVVEWVGAHGPWDDQIVFVFVFVFDSAVMTPREVGDIHVVDAEIGQWRFVDVDDARGDMRDHIWRRLRAALDRSTTGPSGTSSGMRRPRQPPVANRVLRNTWPNGVRPGLTSHGSHRPWLAAHWVGELGLLDLARALPSSA